MKNSLEASFPESLIGTALPFLEITRGSGKRLAGADLIGNETGEGVILSALRSSACLFEGSSDIHFGSGRVGAGLNASVGFRGSFIET